jgi:hypothetical protein
VQGDLAWTAASVFLEFELLMQGLPSASSKEFGTDEHYCTVFEKIGGCVLWGKK